MRYAGFMPNDFIDGQGVCVSLWTQGCPLHCPGCQNPESWPFDGGYEVPNDIKGRIIKAISANGIRRNFSILGGEPLCDQNKEFVRDMIRAVRNAYPNIKIFLWTGYEDDELSEKKHKDEIISEIIESVNVMITGRFELAKRDVSLKWRGSSNQIIHNLM